MHLKITKKYKSLRPFDIELPDFTILTGLNGSGKTQLLEGISGRRFVIDHSIPSRVSNYDQMDRFITLEENGIFLHDIKAVNISTLLPGENSTVKEASQFWREYNNTKLSPEWQTTSNQLYSDIAFKTGKNIEDLEENDFYRCIPISKLIQPNDIFHTSFSKICDTYLKRFEDNNYKRHRANNGALVQALSDEEFHAHYEAPWTLLNEILEKTNTGYTVETPNLQDYDRDSIYRFKLKNINGEDILINDLSSGEKIIFSLIFALYNASFDVSFPQVLLMDEPDASLTSINV